MDECEVSRPPLRPVHWYLIDGLVACALFGLAVAYLPRPALPQPVRLFELPGWSAWLAAGAATLPVAARRWFPLPVLVLVGAASLLGFAAGFRIAPFPGLAYALAWVALVGDGGVALVAVAAAVLVVVPLPPEAGLPVFVCTELALAAAWLIGRTMRQQREYRRGMAEQDRREAQRAVTEQRLRIARELHDVVAHGLSLITVQAGVARLLAAERPDQATRALRTIETTSREAVGEMRRLLGVLRSDDEQDLMPAPGLRELPALLERGAAAGVGTTVHTTGTPRPLPAGIELCAYRIVQEALTNAVRHSTADHGDVTIGYLPGELLLRISHPAGGSRPRVPAAAGGGLGLAGMRERVGLYGGRLRAGHRPDGGFEVTVLLPVPGGAR